MRPLRFLPLLALGLLLAGCTGGDGKSTEGTTGSSQPTEGKRLKVGLLTPGSVSDSGWNALAYEGLKAIESEMGAVVHNKEATGTAIKDSMRSYAQEGYDLVIGHGFEYNEPASEVGKDFPKTIFVTSSGGISAENVGAFRFYLEQGFYLAGMLAAHLSKTGTVAMVGVSDYKSIVSTFRAFEAGAKAAKPGIRVIQPVYFGKEGDIAAAKQQTLSVMDQGADVVIHQANAAAQGVFDAVKEKGGWALGANANQNDNPSGVVIASAVIVAKPAFLELAKQVKEGTYKGKITLVGMDKGAIDFVLNPVLLDKIPTDVQKQIAETMAKIKSGKLVIGKDEF
jgi:basic membrane protein A and related proteins